MSDGEFAGLGEVGCSSSAWHDSLKTLVYLITQAARAPRGLRFRVHAVPLHNAHRGSRNSELKEAKP